MIGNNIFLKQNVIFKFLVVFIAVFLSILLKQKIIELLILLNLLLFLIYPKLVAVWIRSIFKISSFIFSYLLFALILNIDFQIQINFLVRLLFLLQLSIFFTETTKLNEAVNDCRHLLKYKWFFHFFYFLLALMSSIPILKHCWQTQFNLAKSNQTNYSLKSLKSLDYINIVLKTIELSFDKLPFIQWKTNKILNNPVKNNAFFTFPNLVLMYQFSILILSVSF